MILHELKDSKRSSCSEASADLHYCGMAVLAVPLNVSNHQTSVPGQPYEGPDSRNAIFMHVLLMGCNTHPG